MSDFNNHTARLVVLYELSRHACLATGSIRDYWQLDGDVLRLSRNAKTQIAKRISLRIEELGYTTNFNAADMLRCATVGDVILAVREGTDSGGPKGPKRNI